MPTNMKLKVAILESPWTAKVIAEAIQLAPGKLYKIVGGFAKPSADERRKIASVLNKDEEELFDVVAKEAESSKEAEV
jgi:transcriptional regulator with XRE-family HTH domain